MSAPESFEASCKRVGADDPATAPKARARVRAIFEAPLPPLPVDPLEVPD